MLMKSLMISCIKLQINAKNAYINIRISVYWLSSIWYLGYISKAGMAATKIADNSATIKFLTTPFFWSLKLYSQSKYAEKIIIIPNPIDPKFDAIINPNMTPEVVRIK